MCHGRITPKNNSDSPFASLGHGFFLMLMTLSTLLPEGLTSVCPQPPAPENGGFSCHPSPCQYPLTPGSIIEYLCDEGYTLKGDDKYLTCKNGEWDPPTEISCLLSQAAREHHLGRNRALHPGSGEIKGLTSQKVCPKPPAPENGGYVCHPTPCQYPLTSGSVIEYLCDEGYMLKGDYKYLTCKNGEWDPPMEISCRLSPDTKSHPTIGVPTLSIVASTASSVALILLLVVLFVLLQPKLKSFHHSRRDQGVSGNQVSIMVDGVQVSLPSYEEAVYGHTGNHGPPTDSRIQIVLSEGAGPSGAREMLQQQALDRDRSAPGSCPAGEEAEAPGQSGLSSEVHGAQRSETAIVHQACASASASAAPSWTAARKDASDSENSDIQSLLSLTSEEYTDDIPLLKEA
ncbi:sushi domain-containing protein 6 isoform X3 [Ornithorhynchus anatinus]|uniref:sushi domain-containing protein 6 isoform X3 n=1 Tax=Ornithorhynchus anatinus TaxID=9258 RepID=UPI0010A75A7F|nr:sushi domain-containing protein 6 isoform X3 [Ornithorhynchus anatinus]